MLKVVLVDDVQVIINGLKKVIPWREYNCEVVGSAQDGLEGLKLVRLLHPDILITDIRMPNLDGLAMIAALRSEYPDLKITILTGFREFEYAQRAIQLGVSRYLLKPSKMEELCEAIASMSASSAACEETEEPQEQASAVEVDSEASVFVVNAAMQFIKGHYTEHLRLLDVAESVYVSQWHLSKLINRHLGKSFFDILNELRVEQAKKLLLDPALKVHEVADLVGFADVAHFSKTFKKLVRRSPVEFRASIPAK